MRMAVKEKVTGRGDCNLCAATHTQIEISYSLPVVMTLSVRIPLLLSMALLLGSSACAQDVVDTSLPCDPFADVDQLHFDPRGWATNFCEHSVSYSEIISGGPPRDGIPPIDEPSFVSVMEADAWIEDNEPVILVTHGEEARAYPLQILMWHEIVNDVIAGLPVAVTFCPLCNAAMTFERPEIDGDLLTFGTTGNLRHSDLVMWDRQTESWWQQITGEAIVGDLTGTQLAILAAPMVAWSAVKERHESAQVLSRATGFDRPYGRNPYTGYDDIRRSPFLYDGPVGDELPAMARIIGVEIGDDAVAYPLDVLRDINVVNDEIGDVPVTIFWTPGTASVLDDPDIARGRDVGTSVVYERDIDGRTLTFEPGDASRFIDRETGSTWSILGEAIDGPLVGRRLTPVAHHNIFWFVWSAFQPDGTLYSAK
jgi:hypothetical protein